MTKQDSRMCSEMPNSFDIIGSAVATCRERIVEIRADSALLWFGGIVFAIKNAFLLSKLDFRSKSRFLLDQPPDKLVG